MRHSLKEWRLVRFMEKSRVFIECEASHLAKNSPVPRGELIEIGRVALIEAYHAFEGGYTMELKPFCKLCTKRAMRKHIEREMRYQRSLLLRPELPPDAAVVDVDLLRSHFSESLRMATPSVREVANVIFTLPVELCKLINDNKPKKARGFLRRHLKNEMGYSHRQVSTAFKEVKTFLTECHGI